MYIILKLLYDIRCTLSSSYYMVLDVYYPEVIIWCKMYVILELLCGVRCILFSNYYMILDVYYPRIIFWC